MDYKAICAEVIEIARQAGLFIKIERNNFSKSDIEVKSKNSLVSYVDQEAERLIISALKDLVEEAGFIAEEGTSNLKGERYNWIIDPLDGTTNFMHGIPAYSVSIALEENGKIVLGVVYEVNQDECFYASKDGGAFLNNHSISISPAQNIEDSLLATGFPYYDFDRMENYFEVLKKLAHQSRGVRRIGSAAVDLAYVACGRFEGFFEYSLHPWDVAAGAFIVQEAGGTVTDFKGGNNWLNGQEIIAANASIQAKLLELIKEQSL